MMNIRSGGRGAPGGIFLLGLGLLLVSAGCGDDGDPAAETRETPGSSASADESERGPGEGVVSSQVSEGLTSSTDEDAELFCGVWEHMLDERPEASPAEDCRTLHGLERYHCAEHWFWIGLSDRLDLRWDVVERLTEVIEADDGEDPLALSRMHALRGQLKMAIMVEHDRFDILTRMRADMLRVTELDPDNPIIPSFLDSIDLIIAYNTGSEEDFAAMEPRIWDNVERCPLGNILSISGIALGLPMETGWPQSIVDALDGWDCSGVDFCTQNTWKAPYARPGLAYHFGEAYARVGRTDEARTYLTRALEEDGADEWVFRPFVQDSLDDLDGWVADFESLDDDESAGPLTYAGQTFGCVFCHTHDPPDVMVPGSRLGPNTVIESFDDGGPQASASSSSAPGSGGEGAGSSTADGACDNDGDMTILGSSDVGDVVGSCAMSCFGQGEACISDCVQDDTGLSDGCSDCFGEVGQCTVDNCAMQCLSAESEACADCQATQCMPSFEGCAGVEMP